MSNIRLNSFWQLELFELERRQVFSLSYTYAEQILVRVVWFFAQKSSFLKAHPNSSTCSQACSDRTS